MPRCSSRLRALLGTIDQTLLLHPRKVVLAGLLAVATGLARAQTPATLVDFGASAPTPGPLDLAQLSTAGDTTFPDGLNYFTDNQTDHGAGEPGQTFTAPSGTNGFVLTSLALKSAGLNSGGGSPGDVINYVLHIYTVSSSNVSVLASYISAAPISYVEGHWLQWTGLAVALSPGSNYAYSFGKATSGDGWDALGVANGHPYSAGQIALIPPGGGAMTFGSNHTYDASFDIGLSVGPTPVLLTDAGASPPTPGPLDIAQLSTNGNTTFPDGLNYYTDNQTDHGAGEPGQTFITPNATNGFVLTSLALKSAGLDSGNGSPAGPLNYVLHIYTVSGANASLLATYTTPAAIGYTEGDWLRWSGLSTLLSPGTAYAYSFGKAASGGGWDALGVASNHPYASGQIALIPPGGGAMTFGSTHAYDATFDVGLNSAGPSHPPLVTNLPATAVQATAATMNGQVLFSGGALPEITIYYGTNNGGTNASAWQYSGALGAQSGTFAVTAPALVPNTTYFYTAFASNPAGGVWAAPSQGFATLASNPVPTASSMLTYHNDNTRCGANTNETALTLGNVNSSSFGCLFSYPVDGAIYAQPLVVTNVNIPGKGVHKVVYVATEHNGVFAFDADNAGPGGGLLWSTNLGISAVTPNNDFGNRYGAYHDLVPQVGNTGTPVIDPTTGTLYLDAFTHEGTNLYYHRIHALDITTGHERPYSPVVVAASVPGTGVGGSNGVIVFQAEQQLQRPGLTLAGGMLFVAYGSYADTDPYHGWVLGFNATNLALVPGYIFNTTPNATTSAFGVNAGEGALWMGGNGLCVDANTNLFFETANGSFSENTNGGDYGDSFIRLSTTNGLGVADYFTPHDQATLQANDTDLGSGGPVLLPDDAGSAAHPHLITGSGKSGTIYLLDRDGLGRFNSTNDSQIVQELPGTIGTVFGTPAYFNHLLYYQSFSHVMDAFSLTNGVLSSSPVSQSSISFGFPGATPAISANGTNNVIVWAIQADAYSSGGPAVLHAFNGTNLAQELYNSSQNLARDNPGPAVKMTVPTIVGGKVYVGASSNLAVFGSGIFLTSPQITPSGGVYPNGVTITLAGAVPGVSLYYTLDGSTPGTNSILYTGPFTLTNSATVQAVATAVGAVNSPVVSASFSIVPPLHFTSEGFASNGQFQLGISGVASDTYILLSSTNFSNWTAVSTNLAGTNLFNLYDPNATNYRYRFYRILEQ